MDNKVTRFLFWVAFVAFLGSSIPHVAWVYDQFEQGNADINLWGFHTNAWHCLSIMIAVGIDALIAWLSFQLAVGKGKTNARMTWAFIVTLSALSWYCNWIYSVVHSPAAHVNVWSIPILFGWTTVGTFTSFIVSAFPVFSIGYTFMLSRMNENQISLEDLEDQLKRKRDLAVMRRKYASEESAVASLLKQGINEAVNVRRFAIDKLKSGDEGTTSGEIQSSTQVELFNADEDSTEVEVEEELNDEISFQENGTEEETTTDPEVEALNVVPFHQNGNQDFPKISTKEKIARKRLFTIAQAAEELKCTPRHVRNLRKEGTLTSDQNGLIVGSSLRSYIANRKAKIS